MYDNAITIAAINIITTTTLSAVFDISAGTFSVVSCNVYFIGVFPKF